MLHEFKKNSSCNVLYDDQQTRLVRVDTNVYANLLGEKKWPRQCSETIQSPIYALRTFFYNFVSALFGATSCRVGALTFCHEKTRR